MEQMPNKSTKQTNHFNLIKGRIGEAVAEQLFEELSLDFCRFGYEATQPQIVLLRKYELFRDSVAIRRISKQPDFMVTNAERQGTLIEVKYRRRSFIYFSEITAYSTDTSFLFMDNEDFWLSTKIELEALCKKSGSKIYFKDTTLLEEHELFKFNKEQIEKILNFKRHLDLIFGRLPESIG